MKLKKLIISASAIAAGSGILATVLTSCSKADIDDDLKIELNDEGKFANLEGATFKQAIRAALTRSTSWASFKQALADEIVYKWYENRASKDKNDTTKNTSFRSNLDEWKYQIDEDYDDVIDNLKSKYGANYKFYLQNEYLSSNGGTEDAYKHAKMVEKVKSKFIDDAFSTIFFGFKTETSETDKRYPNIFTEANLNIGERELNDPANWAKLGFYAKTDGSFNPGETIDAMEDVKYLAEKPQGDYATLQDYVFNRWFETEKPFFSAAALFKYSAPNSTKEKKLTDIYNGSIVTVPEAPNESFPFFGGQDDAESYKGTLAFYKWYEALNNGGFRTGGLYGPTLSQYNGTVTIGSQYTEDSQTLLLCSARNMIGGTEGGLYIPYGISSASLLRQMFGGQPALKNVLVNHTTETTTDYAQDILAGNVNLGNVPSYLDEARILKNFFFNSTPNTDIKSYIDLENLYGRVGLETDPYHCPLFKNNEDYSFLYGTNTTSGVKYITNNIQLNLGRLNPEWKPDLEEPVDKYLDTQPWVLELNEAGVHAQTIDGYIYVNSKTTASERQKALKEVIKYRLMQKKCGYNDKIISADLIDGSNKLKTYFSNNFADIVLELALSDEPNNIFRNIEDYKETTNKNLFMDALVADQHFSSVDAQLRDYLTKINQFDKQKKAYEAVATANEKIYAYRKDQIANAKNSATSHKKIFENGLIAPLVLDFAVSDPVDFNTTHNYATVNEVIYFGEDKPTLTSLKTKFDAIEAHALFTETDKVTVNDALMGFSPQVKSAKDTDSNRYWYLSPIVDKTMYGFMGGSEIANYIKDCTYQGYEDNVFKDKPEDLDEFMADIKNGVLATYKSSKLLTGDKNFATYAPKATDPFFSVIDTSFTNWLYQRQVESGDYCDDVINFELYKATVSYLYKNNFENLYTALNNKIAHDESAFVGYVNKYDTTNPDYANIAKTSIIHKDETTQQPGFDTNIENMFYKWTADVDNIYDQAGYAGGNTHSQIKDCKISYDQYWHVVQQKDWSQNIAYAGFTGIQTAKTNQIDSTSGLQDAAFKHLAKATQESYYKDGSAFKTHEPNDGAFFAWAGQYEAPDKEYSFAAVKDPDGEGQDITPETFADFKKALKLARKIANATTVQDIRDIAKSLGDAFHGDSEFKRIGYGQTKGTADQLRYKMLTELLKPDEEKSLPHAYAHAFDRLTRVELHGELSEGSPYCFESGSNGYKLLLTQINKSDVTEKTIFPEYKNNEWQMKDGAGVTLDEFWYIFCSIASESSIQQLAIADAVKDQYGADKLKVYDAQLYNQFDSVWIKDWVKKPIGGGES